jgi:membrane protease YdiL (CAAX protease family)
MAEPNPWVAVAALAAYNLIQNFAVPPRVYVAANLGMSAGLVHLARRQGCSWDDLGLSPAGWRRSLAMGGAGSALAIGAAVLTSTNSELRRYLLDERAQSQTRRDVIYRSLVRFPIGTALFEEVAFRGVLYGMWRQAGKSHRAATAITAIAFGVWHLIPSRNALRGNPLETRLTSQGSKMGVIAGGASLTGMFSFGLTWLRIQSGSLVAPWLIHSAVNATGYLAGVRAWRTPPSRLDPSEH